MAPYGALIAAQFVRRNGMAKRKEGWVDFPYTRVSTLNNVISSICGSGPTGNWVKFKGHDLGQVANI